MSNVPKLSLAFYRRDDVVGIARELLGKVLCSAQPEGLTAGIITETEAYAGVTDRASHAWGGRRTERTKTMYLAGGVAYIYLCYGIHSLFNVVTNAEGIPDAVLVRGIYPVDGIRIMETIAGGAEPRGKIGAGPGKLSRIMGLHYSLSGISLLGGRVWIEDRGIMIPETNFLTGKRIGIDYAGEDAHRPYRFRIADPERLPGMDEKKTDRQEV